MGESDAGCVCVCVGGGAAGGHQHGANSATGRWELAALKKNGLDHVLTSVFLLPQEAAQSNLGHSQGKMSDSNSHLSLGSMGLGLHGQGKR